MVKSLAEFCEKSDKCDMLPSGATTAQSGEGRRAIGFGRENETITRSKEDILLEQMGLRRAIGFGRENETIKNGPSGKETAVGFGRENEAAATPDKPKREIGFQATALLKSNRDR